MKKIMLHLLCIGVITSSVNATISTSDALKVVGAGISGAGTYVMIKPKKGYAVPKAIAGIAMLVTGISIIVYADPISAISDGTKDAINQEIAKAKINKWVSDLFGER